MLTALSPVFRFSVRAYKQGQKKFFFLLGAPGVEKEAYAKVIKKDLGLNRVSINNQIRKIQKGRISSSFDKNLIQTIRSIVKSGGLVSDQIIVNIIKEKVKQPESVKGVLLDGFPTTKGQLDYYSQLFPIHAVLNLTLRDDILLQKLMGQRTCYTCGGVFNVCKIRKDGYYFDPLLPKKEGICKLCPKRLETRQNDAQKVIKARMKYYDEKTRPLLQQFQKRRVLINFECKRGVKDYPELKIKFEKKLTTK